MNVRQAIEEDRFGALQEYFNPRFKSEEVLKDDVLNSLKDYYVLTGSRAFNVYHEESDYDYVITNKDAKRLIKNFSTIEELVGTSEYELNVLGNDYNLKLTTKDNKILNFMSYEEENTVKLFDKVNERMIEECSRKELKDKGKRCMHFELFTKELKIHDNPVVFIDEDSIPFSY